MGDGPEREHLTSLVEQLELKHRVTFLGYVSDFEKYKFLALSDLFILTSLHEGFGIVFLESMYCGLPIVCTNHGGQVDFLKDGENAILINVGDVNACADAIKRFYHNREFYLKCSSNNREKVMDFFADRVADQYLHLFHEIIDV